MFDGWLTETHGARESSAQPADSVAERLAHRTDAGAR
jgi:hypothetical protein